MRVCLGDKCTIDGFALPKWFHVCPVCKEHTYDLDEIEQAMKETPIPIEFVDRDDLLGMLMLMNGNQENWDDADWEFVERVTTKYGGKS